MEPHSSINLTGTFLGTRPRFPLCGSRAAVPSSIFRPRRDSSAIRFAPAYSASKGGIRLLTKSTALEYATENIRCNSIHPGPIETDLARDGFGAAGPPAFINSADRVPMRRFGRPEEVAQVIVFLASDESSYMTGSELVIDGGRTALRNRHLVIARPRRVAHRSAGEGPATIDRVSARRRIGSIIALTEEPPELPMNRVA